MKPEEERYKPVFNVLLRDRKILDANTLVAECFVDAKPRAEISWYVGEAKHFSSTNVKHLHSFQCCRTKDGQPLVLDDRISIETGLDGRCAVTVRNFTSADVGLYRCVATNELGKAETNSRMQLEGT